MEHDACVVHQDVELWEIGLHMRRKGGDLRGVCDIALNGVELWVFRFHLIEHGLAATSHDDLVAEFKKLQSES